MIRPEFARMVEGWNQLNHVHLAHVLKKLSTRTPRDFSEGEMSIIAEMIVEQKRLQTLYRIQNDGFLNNK